MGRRVGHMDNGGELQDRPATDQSGSTDVSLLTHIGRDPQTGIRMVLEAYGSVLLGRLHRYAESYGAHVRADVKNILFEVVESLLDPAVRAACRARGGQILPWLSKLGKWRVTDAAREWGNGERLDSLDGETPAPDPPKPVAPSLLVKGLYQALRQLSPRDQLILYLQFHESASMESIAVHLGISVDAAKKAAFDARRRLRRRMEAAGIHPGLVKE
ncbi:MAG TPA: sigma factor-like helix-turn-helix DNA-binding protein [Candidatus Acidoferrales bacterium]|nr:sigma factor-like helix-turn-helix DNA-binding protein [Candidatus Acidoferrales bacterium]